MKFDKSRVYTPVNADELKVGSKVIVADTLYELELAVTNDVPARELLSIRPNIELERFQTEGPAYISFYVLAYLVSKETEKQK